MAEPILVERARDVVERARRAGAQEVFAVAGRSRSVEIQRRDGATERLKEATSRSVSVQLWVDGRYSSQSTTDLRPDALDRFLADAVALTRALQPDPARLITDPALFPESVAPLEVEDPALVAGLDAASRDHWVQTMEAEARRHPRVISCTSNLTFRAATGACATSNGFVGQSSGTEIWPSVEVTLRDDGDKRAADGDGHGARFLADLPDAASIGQNALAYTVARLGAAKVPTTRTTLVVDRQAAGSLIARLLSTANGGSIQQGRSFVADKLGKAIASSKLSILDDPLLPRGLGSRAFDGEGIAARALPIVEKGVLTNVYVDTYYGRKGKLAVTTGAPSNRVVALGSKDRAAWIAEVGRGILVTSFMGGNSDANSGDFSFGIRGHLIDKGQVGAPIGEMNVTGNLLSLFAGLSGVGNDPWRSSAILAPTLVFDNVQFSGA
ncbi:MAG: TldD/PmbA family protein [Myxococcales bacterium]|nr:TldD/PmbA family protein [Myxococcales bacterium]